MGSASPRRGARAAAVLLVLALVTAVPAVAQSTDDLFDGSRLHTIELVIHSRDWADLHANFRSNAHYPADVLWNGMRMRNVGIRSRGAGSRYEAKPGLELTFDHYAS